MLRQALSLIACLCLVQLAAAQEKSGRPPADFAAKADTYLTAQAKVNLFSGSVLLAQGDEILLAKGIGLANIEHAVPNSPDTKFRLGSITKQFTATAILLLEQQGKLALADTVIKHVENVPDAWRPVTIQHLLTHTSGIPSFTSLPGYPASMPLPATPAQTLDRVRELPLEFTPGEKFAYSNSGYVLLGQIIEQVAGQSYADFQRQNIFEPLSLLNTGYDLPEKILPGRASGYRLGATTTNATYLDMTIPHAAGALYSTVLDLHRWSRALDAHKLLSADAYRKMFTPGQDNYGYGWFIDKQFGRQRMHHGGGINGFTTQLVRYPDEQVCVVVLSNTESGYAGEVARDLAALFFGETYALPEERQFIQLDETTLDSYVGAYELAPAVLLTITRDGARLLGQIIGQPRFELRPQSSERFFVKEAGVEIEFVKGDDGKWTELLLKQGERNTKAKRK